MNKYKVTHIIETDNEMNANYVAKDWEYTGRAYPFAVKFGDQTVEQTGFNSTLSDRMVKRLIAGAIIFAISRTLKKWAKE